MEEYKIYALFNNKTRQLTCFTTDISQFPESIRKTLLIREFKLKDLGFDDNEIVLSRFKWIGDYDTGRLADIINENKSVVTEKEIDQKFHTMFWARYNSTEVLYEILLNSDMKTDKGREMKGFLEKVLTKKKTDIDFYKNSPLHIWETNEDIRVREKNAFKSNDQTRE